MPHCEFFCHDCKQLFSKIPKILSFIDYEKGQGMCSQCGSKKVEQRWSAFAVITPKKSVVNLW